MLGHPHYRADVAERARRTWVRGGRLVGLPRKRSRRLPLLDLDDPEDRRAVRQLRFVT